MKLELSTRVAEDEDERRRRGEASGAVGSAGDPTRAFREAVEETGLGPGPELAEAVRERVRRQLIDGVREDAEAEEALRQFLGDKYTPFDDDPEGEE